MAQTVKTEECGQWVCELTLSPVAWVRLQFHSLCPQIGETGRARKYPRRQ
jgi:hypothetical protein